MAEAASLRPGRLDGLDRAAPIWLLAAAALVMLILLPMGWLVYISVTGPRGGFTLAHYARVLGDPPLQKALWNTVVLAFWSGLVALAIGAPMAWLSARTDLPGRRIIQSLIMASFVTPPFLGAFAWVMLAGWPSRLSTPPRLSARENRSVPASTLFASAIWSPFKVKLIMPPKSRICEAATA